MPTGLQPSKSPTARGTEASSSSFARCLRRFRSLSVYDEEEVTHGDPVLGLLTVSSIVDDELRVVPREERGAVRRRETLYRQLCSSVGRREGAVTESVSRWVQATTPGTARPTPHGDSAGLLVADTTPVRGRPSPESWRYRRHSPQVRRTDRFSNCSGHVSTPTAGSGSSALRGATSSDYRP